MFIEGGKDHCYNINQQSTLTLFLCLFNTGILQLHCKSTGKVFREDCFKSTDFQWKEVLPGADFNFLLNYHLDGLCTATEELQKKCLLTLYLWVGYVVAEQVQRADRGVFWRSALEIALYPSVPITIIYIFLYNIMLFFFCLAWDRPKRWSTG